MTRGTLIAVLATLAFAAPADAAFQSCTRDAVTQIVTATFGPPAGFANPTGTLDQSGTAIRADGVQCDGATTANTRTIRVVGQDDVGEELTISLAGGTFLGGVVDEGDGSSEIEFEVDLGSGFGDPDVTILGSSGVDRVTLGETGTGAAAKSTVNLNAGEAGSGDADMTFSTFELFEVLGAGDGDFLSGAGGHGTGSPATQYRLRGEAGNDDLTTTDRAVPGPGNDTVRFPIPGEGIVEYADAGATTITLQPGPVAWGGATNDGQGGADTYVGRADHFVGSDFADTFNGSIHPDQFFGLGGADTIDGGPGDDELEGNDGGDTIHGGADDDDLHGRAGADDVFGDGGDDIVDGGNGVDDEFGGDGDDRLVQTGVNQYEGEETDPNGADDINGGPGIDTLEYGDPRFGTFGGLTTLTGRVDPVTVDLDDAADDGAAGEGDNAHSDLENVIGGVANDTLTGDGDANVLSGFDGADTLRGGGGDDTLRGLGALGGGAATVEAEVVDDADDLDGGPGADWIDANEGDDRIEAREGTADRLDCGPGDDSGRADRIDTINADCEFLELPALPVVETPVPPPLDPPAPPPPVGQPPVVVPPPPTIRQLLSLPSNRRCVSRRKFTVRVRRAIRGQVRRVTIFVNGRRAARVAGRRVALPINLRGLPKGRVRVRLRVELNDGRVATDTRTYRTCTPKRRRAR